MYPLSIFPRLLDFSLVAPTILRFAVASFVLYLGYKRYRKEYGFTSIIYAVSGTLVFIGLYTQISLILAIASLKFDFYIDFYKNRGINPIPVEKYFLYTLASIILLSLLFTGPGLFAFDLPL